MTGSRFRRDERGNMAVLFAFGFAVSAMVSALAVDAASLYHERRVLQAGVDLAAISAATDPARAAEIAQSVLTGAQLLAPASTDGLTVLAGRYDPTEPVIADRFTPGKTPHNAVSVTLNRPGRLYFASSFATVPILRASGIASVTPEVSFSVGSRLASLNEGLANAILSALLGTTVSLSVLDYRALAAARVDALDFLDALATELGVTAGSYDDLLATHAGTRGVAATLAGLAHGRAHSALMLLATAGAGANVDLGKLIDLGRLGRLELGSAGAADLSLSVLELLSAAAALGDGNRQVSLNLGAAVPGLVSLQLDLAVGEPAQGGAWFTLGPMGTIVRTAQTRLRLRAELLGGPTLLGAGVKLPLWLDLAPAEARAEAATCPTTVAPQGSATIAARPGILRLSVGEMSDASLADFGVPPSAAPVRLIDILLLRVTGAAMVELAQTTPVRLNFSSADIAAGTMRTARTETLVASLSAMLLDRLDLTVNVSGLGLSPPHIIAQTVRALLVPFAPLIDNTISGTLSALGLGLGEADVRVYGVRCDRAVLVG
ncbi:putative membrane protein [Devosia subaequoris]|uniref:Putative membrane protein n=1 Tax=Devosia subaequoris TaxID=395930 RepID=A0A7W6INY4_9HYPH|nr:putative membrane protein [Devosia subaequoris]MCP1210490.1 pilus assembly protein TadG-related protein [Devosia subaequoris]